VVPMPAAVIADRGADRFGKSADISKQVIQ
jgi:hypothetical protein